jgi:putative SOS response-associated peptidase YedK
MCGRFAMDDKVNELITEFVTVTGKNPNEYRADWTPAWNIAPTDPIPVLFESAKSDGPPVRRFENAHWSLVPPGSKDMRTKFTFNARAERIMSSGLWKRPVSSRRAIVLANGYYEWQGEKGHKTPYFIHDPAADVIGFAGLYSWWPDPAKAEGDNSRWHLTATILTSDAVETLADIHDRNPVILPKDMWAHWIDATVVGDQDLVDEAVRAGVAVASQLDYYRIAPIPFRGEGPQLIDPV